MQKTNASVLMRLRNSLQWKWGWKRKMDVRYEINRTKPRHGHKHIKI